jgi:ABC-type phosphate transport system substrate-binding protein
MKKIFLVAALFLGLTVAAKAQDVAFIVHPDLAETGLTADDVKNVLLGNMTKWPHGTVIKLVVLTEGAEHAKVIRDYTQRSPEQFDKFWKRQVFTGAGVMPAQVKTDAEVIAYVAANPGAFGYILKESANPQVKILSVQ